MGKTMIDAEAVAIPASVARDLISALSAENVRLRAELKTAAEENETREQSVKYYRGQMEDWRGRVFHLQKLASERRAEVRRANAAARREGK